MPPVKSNRSRLTLQDRLVLEAGRLKDEARAFPHGPLRDEMIRKARQTEIAAHLDEWITSPGLKTPR